MGAKGYLEGGCPGLLERALLAQELSDVEVVGLDASIKMECGKGTATQRLPTM